jgi:cobalt-zinc-cadmium efflux system outer membrane protein
LGGTPSALTALSLEEAWNLSLEASPQLRAAELTVLERSSERNQASRRANPSLTLESENVAGTGPYSGTDAAEYTLAVEVPVELGGKRAARANLAGWEVRQSELQVIREKLKLHFTVESRFIDWLEAQAMTALAEKRLEASRQAAAVVATRSEEGAATGLDRSRTQVDVSRAETEMQRARESQSRAARMLFRLWNAEPPMAEAATGSLDLPDPLPPEAQLRERLKASIHWQAGALFQDKQEMVLDLARSAAWPDLSVSAGHRWLEETEDDAWVLGVSLTLPIFDRNRDGVKAATAGLSRAAAEREAFHQSLLDSFEEAYGALAVAGQTSRRILEDTLPPARETFRLVTEGYRLGRYDLLYLLEAEHTLFAVENDLLQSRAEGQRALAQLNYLLHASGDPGSNRVFNP